MANCPHGFPEDQCLICQALGMSRGQSGKAAKTKAPPQGLLLREPQAALPATKTRALARPRRSGTASILTGLGIIVVGGLLVWAFAGLFVLAFHIFEYAALAVVAGWAGYKLGHARGRRERRPST